MEFLPLSIDRQRAKLKIINGANLLSLGIPPTRIILSVSLVLSLRLHLAHTISPPTITTTSSPSLRTINIYSHRPNHTYQFSADLNPPFRDVCGKYRVDKES